ncbi:hypothetical protein [Flavobacterium limnophilum]|uniref:hypothetical protein n=1 Tax=Flavobacterium limnophilum TaxID=3003262 RepID=UPI002482F778|nr:hypothetical protein [Flavobacterium limnophilum]
MKKNYFLLFALLFFASLVQGQITNAVTYDFRDGTIITAKQSTDGKLTLAGAYIWHNNSPTGYGLQLKVNQEINIAVPGSCTIRFLGSTYSGLKMVGTASVSGDLGTQVTKVATDKVDTYDFVYSGVAKTLNFKTIAGTGNDVYLPKIEVIPAQLGKNFTVAEKNIPYYFDLRDGSIVPSSPPNTITAGLFKIEAGATNGLGLNGIQHGITFKDGNKITLQVAGNSYIRVAADQYSAGVITASSATGAFNVTSQNNNTGATFSDGNPLYVDFLYVGTAGTVVLNHTGGGTAYLPYIEISPNPYAVSLSTYVQKSGTVTLNGVTINLSSGATATDNATITLSSGVVLSSLPDNGFVAIDLGGNISTLTPTVSGDIASATISGGNLNITYANSSTDPKTYTIKLYDNSYLNGTTKYDFTDGTIITNKQSTDGLLTLAGAYTHQGTTYGLDLKANQEMNIAVAGSSALKFLGSQYSSLSMSGTATVSGDLGTQATKVTTDLVDTYDFVYSGASKALNFKAVTPGSDVYLPSVSVIPAQMGAAYTASVKNVPYFFDFRDGSIIPKITPGNVGINKGLVEIVPGASNTYGYNGSQHGSVLKAGNQIKLQVNGNSYIKVGGSIFSAGTISVSSATGNFDKSSQSSTTLANFDTNRTSVDFLYVGTAGVVTLDFTGTNYVPYIEVVPVTTPVSLTPWVQKAGTITINGTVVTFTAGADASANATVALSTGTVISATNETASIQIPLNGKALSYYTPTLTGDIASVAANGNVLTITFSDPTSNPTTYALNIADNSVVVEAIPGKTYTYNFANGTVLPQTSYQALRYNTFTTSDGILNLKSNTTVDASKFGYHDAAHGAVFFPGNSMDIIVAGNATVTFVVCTYGGGTDGVFEFKDSNSNVLGSVNAQNIGGADGTAVSFTYTGPKGVITATLKSASFPNAEFYIHGMNIENAATIVASNGKTDAWDFGAVQLDTSLFNNQLTATTINSWYNSSIVAGSTANVLPSFTAGVLSWVGGSDDRLRTTNTNLTRFDENIAGAVDYTGRVYVNAAAASGRYMSLTLSADDEITIFASTDAGGIINFQYVADAASQTNQVSVPTAVTELHFVAKQAGTYHVFDTQGKPSYYRILRKDAVYKALTGNVDVTLASGIPSGYTIVFTNEAGKIWSSAVSGGTYNVNLPQGYTYALSLAGANGYIISNGTSLNVTNTTTTYDIAIQAVELHTVSGNITGLGTDISKVTLNYVPAASANKIYVPTPVINTGAATYTVQLEPNVEYTISGQGVNNYEILSNKITIGNAAVAVDVAFTAKPVYNVAINTTGLDATQLSKLALTFTNLNESGYVYNFSSVSGIALRNGVYTVAYSGLDEYPVETGLISNLTVNGANTSKAFDFKPVTNWSFDDKVIANGTPAYKGMLFTGTIANEIAKGHITTKAGATIKVPVNVGDKVTITYYYSADFSIEGGTAITTASNSTTTFENVEYSYAGSVPGFVTITVGSGAATTYFTNIAVGGSNPYKSIITVGTDKEYQTINAALSAVSKMTRTSSDRVTIMIDPGNYEEMLEITQANVTLKNAATTPNIDLLNKGVDIKDGAVRITSYYGHGYNYYSMKNNQKWNADVLKTNKENGYLTYENKGSGTTNGSYWNATVVVYANGFEANDIIFENSFNQYISKKESEDVVVMWTSESKGVRPTNIGNTAVQDRSFVERAAALSITNNVDKVVLNKCRVVGRQDSFFGGVGSRVVVYKGVMMGAVDYIFGGMTAVFYKTDLAMNTSDVSGDESYLTAAQQASGRGYLMYECNVTTAIPGTETASTYRSKPGYFGRPWQATTSEVVFYNTTIETSNFPGSEGLSLIKPLGWQNSLGGISAKMYEYGTIENSGVDNSSSRASWATKLSSPTLTDGTAITTLNFTKGSDGWDPIPQLIANDPALGIKQHLANSNVNVYAYKDVIVVSNVKSNTKVNVYNLNGALVKSFDTIENTQFNLNKGIWIVVVKDAEGQKAVKLMTY